MGSDLRGATGELLVTGDDQHETRLLDLIKAHPAAAPAIDSQYVEVVLFDADIELSRKRVNL